MYRRNLRNLFTLTPEIAIVCSHCIAFTERLRCIMVTFESGKGKQLYTKSLEFCKQKCVRTLILVLVCLQLLRDMFIFKIVPMLNPDGVIVGNYRCSLAGRDLNRNYKTVLKDSFPPIWHVRNMVRK